jgi:flagellar basal-body rod protein FlgF
MENTVYIALSQQTALRRQLDVIANNLANMNTPSYKNESLVFEKYLMPAGADHTLSYVEDYGMVRNETEGPLQKTGNPLDIAVEGPGYFTVQTPNGVEYTRDGHLQLSGSGELVTDAGYPVLDTSGQPITIDPHAGSLAIAADGTLSTPAGGPVGQINLVEFANPQALREAEGGYYTTTTQTPLPAQKTQLVQGMIEQSNVNPVVEITRMMTLLRNYQSTENVLKADNQRRIAAIQNLEKVP